MRARTLVLCLLGLWLLAAPRPNAEAAEDANGRLFLERVREAAEQGDARTQYNLGVLYDIGDGVPMDKGMAAKWYQKAADQGYAMAQNNLGNLYSSG